MRICHIIADLQAAPAAESALAVCEELARRKHDVILIAGPEGELWDRARAGGYRRFRIPSLQLALSLRQDVWSRILLDRLLRQLKPEIMHTHATKAGLVGRWAASRVPGTHLVHTVHELSFHERRKPWTRWFLRRMERRLGRRTGALIAATEAIAERLAAAGAARREQLRIIPAGGDEIRSRVDRLEALYAELAGQESVS
ncbi:MAG: glycosyltransferase [Candidatus Eisenbacteria bacterium]|nr:glycosyltransferase [Candidatus Eisenbacteria bacterium]